MRTAHALAGLKGLAAASALLAFVGSALAANWINPHTGMSFAPVIVITPGAPSTIDLCAVNSCNSGAGLTTTGNAVVTPTTIATTNTTVGANGSRTNSTTAPTTSSASNIYVAPTYAATFRFGNFATTVTASANFTFASLTSGPQTSTVCVGYGCTISGYPDTLFTFTATPSASGQVTIVATAAQQNCDGRCPTQTSTLTLNVPLPASTTNNTNTIPGIPPLPTDTAPVKGPEPTQEAAGGPTALTAEQAQANIDKCGIQVPNCVADELDAYANHLEQIVASLPPSMRKLPQIFHEAARKVREAKTPAAAVRAITTALAQVKTSISLIRVVDADTRALGKEVGAQSVGVLESAKVALSRVSGL